MTETRTASGLYIIENKPVYVVEACPGQGIQEAGGGELPGIDPDILNEVCATMTEAIDGKIDIHWLLTSASQEEINSSQEHIQLFIVALERVTQLSIDKMLKEKHGIDYEGPGIVFGHSVGEIAALIRKDVIDETYAAVLTYERARLMGEAGRLAAEGKLPGFEGQMLPGGALVVIGKYEDEVQEAIDGNPGNPDLPELSLLRIAAYNGEKLFTVSGPKHELKQLEARVRTLPVDTNVAVHNELFMGDVAEELDVFVGRADDFTAPASGKSVVLNGKFVERKLEAADSIVDGVVEPVMFDKGSKLAIEYASSRVGENGTVVVIETNPNADPKLLPMMRETKKAYGDRLIRATFGDVLEHGLDIEALRATKNN